MLSKELEITLNLAFKSARRNSHEFMTVEHLLLGLLLVFFLQYYMFREVLASQQ